MRRELLWLTDSISTLQSQTCRPTACHRKAFGLNSADGCITSVSGMRDLALGFRASADYPGPFYSAAASISDSALAPISDSTTQIVPTPQPDIEGVIGPSDLWSNAYREAVQNMEHFKLALDLTAPLTAFEPVTSTVFSVMKGITAALVSVYQKLLEFYASAYEFLMQRRTRLVLAVLSDADTLPAIVKDVLEQAGHLRAVVEKVTFDIVQDIKAMLYNEKISQWLGHDNLSQQSRHHVDLKSLRADSACEWLLEKPEFKSWYGSFNF
ncbi:hypothetical protein HYE68_008603 [Fusarium pseudograminearum]|nr:hypothetical protein HYE68_008603 [Fusarium pseudograminearum]